MISSIKLSVIFTFVVHCAATERTRIPVPEISQIRLNSKLCTRPACFQAIQDDKTEVDKHCRVLPGQLRSGLCYCCGGEKHYHTYGDVCRRFCNKEILEEGESKTLVTLCQPNDEIRRENEDNAFNNTQPFPGIPYMVEEDELDCNTTSGNGQVRKPEVEGGNQTEASVVNRESISSAVNFHPKQQSNNNNLSSWETSSFSPSLQFNNSSDNFNSSNNDDGSTGETNLRSLQPFENIFSEISDDNKNNTGGKDDNLSGINSNVDKTDDKNFDNSESTKTLTFGPATTPSSFPTASSNQKPFSKSNQKTRKIQPEIVVVH